VTPKMPGQSLASPNLFPVEFPLANRNGFECRLLAQYGIGRTYLSSVERSERDVSIDNIARIARGCASIQWRNCAGGKYDPTPSPRRAELAPRYSVVGINRHDGPEDFAAVDAPRSPPT
jgi:hypothetical protein